MSTTRQIDADLKSAMLAGDKTVVTVLRGLKSAILNVEIAEGKRGEGLAESVVIDVLSKEAKKRQESADLYLQGGDELRRQAELTEKKIIEKYLPAQLSDKELKDLIDKALSEVGVSGNQAMGQIIGKVKTASKGRADGARIAAMVKDRLAS